MNSRSDIAIRRFISVLILASIAASNVVLAGPTTLHQTIGAWQLKCKADSERDEDSCHLISGPYVGDFGGRYEGYSILVSLPLNVVSIVVSYPERAQIQVDENEAVDGVCHDQTCDFRDTGRMIQSMTSGSLLAVTVTKSNSSVREFVSLEGFALLKERALARTGTTETRTGSRPLTREEVVELQVRLSVKGYEPGPPEGHLTGETKKSIAAYQIDHDLPVNGQPTRSLLEHLRANQ